MIELRNAIPTEHAIVKSMMRHFRKEYAVTDHGSAEVTDGYVNYLIDNNQLKLVLKNGIVVGYVDCKETIDNAIYIDVIFIKSFERKKGFSTDVYKLLQNRPKMMSISCWRVYQQSSYFRKLGFDCHAFVKNSNGTRGLMYIGDKQGFEIMGKRFNICEVVENEINKPDLMEGMKQHVVLTHCGVNETWDSSKNSLMPVLDIISRNGVNQKVKDTSMFVDLVKEELAVA